MKPIKKYFWESWGGATAPPPAPPPPPIGATALKKHIGRACTAWPSNLAYMY